MGRWGESDVYCSPKKFGLKVVGYLDEPGMSYEFHMLGVWQHEDGRLFYATDYGCSCPSPFENCTSLDDLDEIEDVMSFADFEKDVNRFPNDDPAERSELLADVRALFASRLKAAA